MTLKIVATALFLIISSHIAKAQLNVSDLVKEWERSKAYTKEYLDAMPEGKYALKPMPEMRSFADQFLHLADANYGLFTAVTGIKSSFEVGELEKTSSKSKSNVSQQVMASYDFIIDNLKKMTDTQLRENIKLFGKFDMTKVVAINKVFEHQVHHRGQTTVYLRLAGITPPEEKLF